ncbi:MAG: serine hydrolase [Bacteroidetes bacterium]|nr:serine hydrolase [Bacteroidota bacterium]
MKKRYYFLLGLVLILILTGIIVYPKYQRVTKFMNMFKIEQITENFLNMNSFIPSRELPASQNKYNWDLKKHFIFPDSFSLNDQKFEIQTYLDSSFTTGLLIVQNDSLAYEYYNLGHSESNPHIAWSVSKSVLSALIGIAIEEGKIKSIEENIEVYVPELIGSGYEGVKIKDILQMSTGVRFVEDYGDMNSDINRWGRDFALGNSQDKFASSLENEREPGTYHHYVSINTHVLGMLLVRTTGMNISEYMSEKLWNPIGAEFGAYWLIDDSGMEMALGGLNACLRDFAKVGMLYLHEGNWQGQQLVPRAWIKASVTPDASHLMPGTRDNSAHLFGYGYQWWIPEGNEGEFLGIGVYNQYLYVNPTTKTVIVKNSANYRYNEPNNVYRSTLASLEMFRKIAHLNAN